MSEGQGGGWEGISILNVWPAIHELEPRYRQVLKYSVGDLEYHG